MNAAESLVGRINTTKVRNEIDMALVFSAMSREAPGSDRFLIVFGRRSLTASERVHGLVQAAGADRLIGNQSVRAPL